MRCAALAVIGALVFCSAQRAIADVTFFGSVNPDPPAAGGTFAATTTLIVGDENDTNSADIRAWLSVDDGTLLQYGKLIVGDEEDFFGDVVVDGNFLAGKNTQFNFSGTGSTSSPTVQIGNDGTGTLRVGGGSTMNVTNQSGNMSIGFDLTSVGRTTITDPFTILTVEDNIFVGQSGLGRLDVLNGALVRTLDAGTSRFVSIGTNPEGIGYVLVDGTGSVLRSASSLRVGESGVGTLRIANGAIVDADNGNSGLDPLLPTKNTVGQLGRIELDGGTYIGFGSTATVFHRTVVDGYLGGSGLVRGGIQFNDIASAQANAGDVLIFDGLVSNQGSVTIDQGEMRFLRDFTNNVQGIHAAPGRIALENGGTVRFSEPLVNNGVLSNAHGTTNIHGFIDNPGEIVVARDTVATFYDTVNNTGMITVLPGGNALFLGDLTFLSMASLALGIDSSDGGDLASHVNSSGVMTLGGTLEITLEGGYDQLIGQQLQLLSAAGGIVGAFDSIQLPLVPNDLEIGLSYSLTGLTMEVKVANNSINLPGDYNNDGSVDAADYAVWRNNLGSFTSLPNDDTPGFVDQDDYTRWTLHFGEVAVVGAGAAVFNSPATPEPSTALLAAAAISGLTLARRRRR